MSFFVKTTIAPTPRTRDSLKVSIFFAALLVVMALTQLFTFEDFLVHIQSLGLPLGEAMTYALGPLIVISEVFAIPFLLRMSLSPAFRYVSMLLGWLVAGIWLFISLWLAVTNSHAETVGFLGTLVNSPPGWWAVFISFALVILAAWSSWGLWPGKRTEK